ncbi:MAG: hypothetical protein M1548_05655 [Actinobacteria bacterium]|nr:hypothetical protein [Actinomycetota bacterium]
MRKTVLFVVVIMLGLVSFVHVATGAPIPNELEVQFWPEYDDNQVLFMETVQFPSDTPLPVEVKMAMPKGASVIWTGEILGGPTSQDIQAQPTINDKGDYDEAVFTLTKSRIAQLEARWNGLKTSGDERSLLYDWIQRYEAKQTKFTLKAPSQSTDVKMTPASQTQGSSPDNLNNYSTAPLPLAVGQKQTIDIKYKRSITGPSVTKQQQQQPAQGENGAGAGAAPTDNMGLIFIALIIGGVGFLLYQKIRNRNA